MPSKLLEMGDSGGDGSTVPSCSPWFERGSRWIRKRGEEQRIVTIPAAEIPRLIGDAEALKARLWARLQESTASVTAAPPAQRDNSSHRLVTAVQAAERLDVPLARLYELVRTGTLPAVRIGRQIRFSPETLAEWIDGGGQALVGGWRRESKSS